MKAKIKNIAVTVVFAVVIFGLSVSFILKPAGEFSVSERRALLQFPVVSIENIMSGKFMTDFESYTLDQFPLRDGFRTVKALFASKVFRHKDNNDIYVENGIAAQIEYPLNVESVSNAAKKFNYIKEKYLNENNKIYLSLIPDKNYFLAPSSGRLSLNYKALVSQLCEEMQGEEYIDIFELLNINDYYKTDTHWRQESLVKTAEKLLNEMGTSASFSALKENVLDVPFHGVYYGQSALPLDAEQIKYYTSDMIDSFEVYDRQNDKPMSVYDMEKARGKDPYEMFLSGSLSLITIDNPNATTDKGLVLFRDSFGSSIAPLLACGYSKVTVVDIRYIQSAVLDRFVDFENADVLFLYSTLVLNNSETLK